jgi:hypothetical protein
MREVTVHKEELLKALRANRANHREEFLEAQEGWKRVILDELEQRLEDARVGRNIKASFSFPEPHDHTKDYDRVIRMVEMEVCSQMTIDEHDFAQFVMDDWEWKANWTASNSGYRSR